MNKMKRIILLLSMLSLYAINPVPAFSDSIYPDDGPAVTVLTCDRKSTEINPCTVSPIEARTGDFNLTSSSAGGFDNHEKNGARFSVGYTVSSPDYKINDNGTIDLRNAISVTSGQVSGIAIRPYVSCDYEDTKAESTATVEDDANGKWNLSKPPGWNGAPENDPPHAASSPVQYSSYSKWTGIPHAIISSGVTGVMSVNFLPGHGVYDTPAGMYQAEFKAVCSATDKLEIDKNTRYRDVKVLVNVID